MSLRNIDLNLLPVLAALCADPNTGRVARRLGLTQSAVSHALARLRSHFDDDLFVRSGRGLEPTPLTSSLRPALEQTMLALEGVANHAQSFTPATSDRAFSIGLPEHVSIPLLPVLMDAIGREAPRVILNFYAVHPAEAQEKLANGVIEIYCGFCSPAQMTASTLRTRALYDEDFICVMNARHPLAKKRRITLHDYLSARHLKLSLQGENHSYIDTVLDGMGHARSHVLTLPFYLLGFEALRNRDLLATMPASTVRFMLSGAVNAKTYHTTPLPFPAEALHIAMYWHTRQNGDAGHSWLRNTIYASAKNMAGKKAKR